MRRTNIYLTEEHCEALDRWSVEQGVSRAELIRRVLDRWLAGGAQGGPEADLDVIEASFGALSDGDFATRGPDERTEHLDRVWRLCR